ncbi:MAG: hypothetical protein R6V17_04570 [Halanaerobacter sp.]
MSEKKYIISLLILLILFIFPEPIAAIEIEWDSIADKTFNVDTATMLENVYLKEYRFRVSTAKDYRIEVKVEKFTENNAFLPLKMNNNNSAVKTRNDFCAAFDLALTDENDVWTDFETAKRDISNQSVLRTDEFNIHKLALALVLVDEDNYSLDGIIKSTAGTSECRRFNELPAGDYEADLVVTVTEDL